MHERQQHCRGHRRGIMQRASVSRKVRWQPGHAAAATAPCDSVPDHSPQERQTPCSGISLHARFLAYWLFSVYACRGLLSFPDPLACGA